MAEGFALSLSLSLSLSLFISLSLFLSDSHCTESTALVVYDMILHRTSSVILYNSATVHSSERGIFSLASLIAYSQYTSPLNWLSGNLLEQQVSWVVN